MYVAPVANSFFGVPPSSRKHFIFHLHACNLFQCLQPLQTVYFKIFQLSPSKKKKGSVPN